MTTYIQFHILTAYPPSNLNRDDLGRPKTAIIGNSQRSRVSSQCQKRTWRVSIPFNMSLSDHMGIRTKLIGIEINEKLINGGIEENEALEWTVCILKRFGIIDEKNPLQLKGSVFFSHIEKEKINKLIQKMIETKKGPSEEDLKLLTIEGTSIDIAMFGRMLADSPEYNVEAAVQVAQSISIHRAVVEDDYFTTCDDLSKKPGASHIGNSYFSAALFYSYISINKDLFLENLGNLSTNTDLVDRSIMNLAEAILTVSPNGKRNSNASQVYAPYLLAQIGEKQTNNLSIAFLKAIDGDDYLTHGINALRNMKENFDLAYGPTSTHEYELSVLERKGTFDGLKNFLTGKN